MTIKEALEHLDAARFEWNEDYAYQKPRFEALDMAIEALKAQEPRVMTFDEVRKHYNLPPVFVEDFDAQEDYYQDIQPLYFEFPNQSPWDVHWRGSNQVRAYLEGWEDRYNKTWRCWTSRPTDAQREATPWQ